MVVEASQLKARSSAPYHLAVPLQLVHPVKACECPKFVLILVDMVC